MMNSRNLFWQLPLMALVLAPLWLQPLSDFLDPEQSRKISKSAEPQRNFRMDSITLVQIRDAQEEFLLNADSVVSSDNQETLELQNPRAVLKGSSDKIRVSGQEAVYETEKEILTILKDVKLLLEEGTEVDTQVIRYLARFRKVKSAAALDFKGKDMRVTGTSFFYDLNSGNFRVGKRVKCNIY